MQKLILIYALSLAALIGLLKFLQYKYLIRDLSIEFYLGLLAILFTAVGIWAGRKLTSQGKKVSNNQIFSRDESVVQKLGLSKRELEVLEYMASGLSNQEIADKIFVSLNTVKTHTSNLFVKLDAKRRTQAIQRARDLKLIQ
jgi:NarL family two-component system response regulator LiaR